jgi:hypothetical protein
MQRWTRLLGALAGVTLAVSIPAARQTPGSSIQGTVVTAAGTPASGFYVVVLPADQNRWPTGGAAGVRRVSVDAGQFAISDLPPGRYSFVFATEAMLADWPAMSTLTTLSRRRPLPIDLRIGQTLTIRAIVEMSAADVVANGFQLGRLDAVPTGPGPLPPGMGVRRGGAPAEVPARTLPGAISGRVTDSEGRPVVGMELRALRDVNINRGMTLAFYGAPAMTDLDGRYRLLNRSAGEYLVVAVAAPPDRPNGGLRASPAAQPASGASGQRSRDVNTFFGHVSDWEHALRVAVAASETAGIDIQLVRQPVFEVKGIVGGFDGGRALPGIVTMIDARSTQNPLSLRRASLNPDGTFTIPDVPGGDYALSAQTETTSINAPGVMATRLTEWASSFVRIDDRLPEPVVMTMRPPARVSGRVEFQGTTPPPALTGRGTTPSVELVPAVMTIGASVFRVPVQPDLSFDATAAGPGPFHLRGVAPAPWIQVAGVVDGVDTLDIPLEAIGDGREGTIVFADHPTAVRVDVLDARDRPADDVTVVAFSEDSRYWPMPSRRIQTCLTSAGTCTFTGLPPGEYLVAAARGMSPATMVAPAELARRKRTAVSLALAATARRVVQVRVP